MAQFKPDKSKMKDKMERPLTLGLFLEVKYDKEFAMYSLGEEDKVYHGVTYPSLKRLYLEMEDPIEYKFATTYLLGWKHWQRICENAMLRRHVDEWRTELELKLAATGVEMMLEQAETNMQAAKWLAERGWGKRGAGRPKKEAMEMDRRVQEALDNEYSADIIRLDVNK